MLCPSVAKPEGGFRFISVVQLCALWSAYQAKLISPFDIQVWFAAQEMVARRCVALKNGKPVSYTDTELSELIGRGGGSAALSHLTHYGLITWIANAVTFPTHPHLDGQREQFEQMLKGVPNNRRQVPVPRRLLRFLARGCTRVLVATILGHLFRCLYYREGKCRPEGLCKASWIAEVFSVSERAVKTARHRLEALGFLVRTPTKQWVLNRYGQKMTVNLQWEQPPILCPLVADVVPEIAPLLLFSLPEIAPPDSNTELRTEEEKNQKPAGSVPPGFLSALFTEMREHVRTGTAPHETVGPSVMRSNSASYEQKKSIPPRPTVPLAAPVLTNVLVEDLWDTERLLALYQQAMKAKLVGKAEAEQLAFFALAQHVITYGPANPGGLFRQLLARKQFQVITQEEEDAAVHRLKRYRAEQEGLMLLRAAS